MSIQSEIARINNNIGAAYDAVEAKGGTLPSMENSNNLATAIQSISSGGGDSAVVDEFADVLFADFAGNPLYTYSLAEIAELNNLPPVPDYPFHIFTTMKPYAGSGTWSMTLDNLKQVKAAGITVMPIYGARNDMTGASKHLEYIVKIYDYELPFCFNLPMALSKGTGTLTVNWDDGVSETFDSTDGAVFPAHIYTEPGFYHVHVNTSSAVPMSAGEAGEQDYKHIIGVSSFYSGGAGDVLSGTYGKQSLRFETVNNMSYNHVNFTSLNATLVGQRTKYYIQANPTVSVFFSLGKNIMLTRPPVFNQSPSKAYYLGPFGENSVIQMPLDFSKATAIAKLRGTYFPTNITVPSALFDEWRGQGNWCSKNVINKIRPAGCWIEASPSLSPISAGETVQKQLLFHAREVDPEWNISAPVGVKIESTFSKPFGRYGLGTLYLNLTAGESDVTEGEVSITISDSVDSYTVTIPISSEPTNVLSFSSSGGYTTQTSEGVFVTTGPGKTATEILTLNFSNAIPGTVAHVSIVGGTSASIGGTVATYYCGLNNIDLADLTTNSSRAIFSYCGTNTAPRVTDINESFDITISSINQFNQIRMTSSATRFKTTDFITTTVTFD